MNEKTNDEANGILYEIHIRQFNDEYLCVQALLTKRGENVLYSCVSVCVRVCRDEREKREAKCMYRIVCEYRHEHDNDGNGDAYAPLDGVELSTANLISRSLHKYIGR